MKAKLIKLNVGVGYRLDDENGNLIATTLTSSKTNLSLKNCEAIANGYDLDELFESVPRNLTDENDKWKLRAGFITGFQKALEILGDKKFSEENMLKSFITGVFTDETSDHDFEFTELMKDLQQTEWDCIIEMEEIQEIYRDGTTKYERVPKLDAGGCIVLKRK